MCDPVRADGRGGARNHRGRKSHELKPATVTGLWEAALFAPQAGVPLNVFKTIHWQKAGVSDPLAATGRFLKLAGDWVRSRGGESAHVWAREAGDEKGEHVHILLYVPPDLAKGLARRQRGWLQACGADWRRGVILTRSIGRSLRHATAGEVSGGDYQAHLKAVVGYVLKGGEPGALEALGLERMETTGAVVGKRAGVSQNLGPSARRRYAKALPASPQPESRASPAKPS
jgi:hypothetical protein